MNPIIDKNRHYIVSFSGGKDSTALWIYLKLELGLENLHPVFADTGWEHNETYKYIDYVESKLGRIERIIPPLSFVELAKKKGRFPSVKARFCTTELKLKPMRGYIIRAVAEWPDKEPIVCCGVRADESPKRAMLPEWEERDDFYNLPQWRPLIKWTSEEVFAMHKKHGIDPNPLYKQGAARVGCMPCIMTNLKELNQIGGRWPDVIDKCADAEKQMHDAGHDHSSLWAHGDIPERHCSRIWKHPETGVEYAIPTARDVFKYAMMPKELRRMAAGQGALFKELDEYPSCHSIYGLCE